MDKLKKIKQTISNILGVLFGDEREHNENLANDAFTYVSELNRTELQMLKIEEVTLLLFWLLKTRPVESNEKHRDAALNLLESLSCKELNILWEEKVSEKVPGKGKNKYWNEWTRKKLTAQQNLRLWEILDNCNIVD